MVQNNEALLRQYELMVDSANQVTSWRQNTNSFYLTVNTTLLAIASYLFSSSPVTGGLISSIGIVIALLWRQSINYYSKLNGAKFKVIHIMEKRLPIEMFKLEHEYLTQNKCNNATQIEKNISIIFVLVYVAVLIASILTWWK